MATEVYLLGICILKCTYRTSYGFGSISDSFSVYLALSTDCQLHTSLQRNCLRGDLQIGGMEARFLYDSCSGK